MFDTSSAANHLLPPSPAISNQRLCQPGESQTPVADYMLSVICMCLHIDVCVKVMGVVGPSSVADGLPLLHLSPYLSPPLPFSTAVVRLVAMQIQV